MPAGTLMGSQIAGRVQRKAKERERKRVGDCWGAKYGCALIFAKEPGINLHPLPHAITSNIRCHPTSTFYKTHSHARISEF